VPRDIFVVLLGMTEKLLVRPTQIELSLFGSATHSI